MIVAIPAGVLLVTVFLLWRRARRKAGVPGPLAGFDTGVRSAHRSPSRWGNHRRTL